MEMEFANQEIVAFSSEAFRNRQDKAHSGLDGY